jgi:hypothetical protein
LKKYNFTIEELMEAFTYDPETGEIRWARVPAHSTVKVGAIAGSIDNRSNTRKIKFKGKQHYAHRFAWMLHNEELILDEKLQVDHINHDSMDNRACNLRLVTQSANCQNKRKQRNSKSKYKGVSWDEASGKWMARISINGKRLYARLHIEEDDAARAVYALCKKHGREDTLNFYEDLSIKDQHGVYTMHHQTLQRIIKKDRPFVCCITGATENLHMHHLKDVNNHEDLFYAPDNVVILIEELHREFHSKYGRSKTTPKQFEEFLKNKLTN